jgi:dihydrofolate synthase / folylpolyglutamate synthase
MDRFPISDSRFPALARLESLSIRGMKLGLAAIDSLCQRLERPQTRVPSVLIAGTNGKGSTAATLSAIATCAGLRSGLYTSPHLVHVTERVRIDDADVSDGELEEAVARVFRAADEAPGIPATYFEALTAAAFLLFAGRRLDLAILEVGLGGRLDATNVSSPELSVVTSISLDHTEELGPTVAAITREKAGIFRRGKPALVQSSHEEALESFRDAAAGSGALLHEMHAEVTLEAEELSLQETRFRLRTPRRTYELATPLLGEHQAWNAATAARAAELLPVALEIDAAAVVRGVAAVRWPGRLERFLVRGHLVFLDGCHNPEGAASLARFLASTDLEADLVFGAMADKDIEAMAAVLAKVVGAVRLVPVASPRAATSGELKRRVAPWRSDAVESGSLGEALEEFLSLPGEKPIIVAGSLYLVGQARALLAGGQIGEGRP